MGGGTLQLAAYGEQDIYLTGNPIMSYFKYVYKRHTNFSIETIEYPMDGTVGINETKTSVELNSNSGDLLYKCTLQLEFTADINRSGNKNDDEIFTVFYSAFVNGTGYAYIKEVSIAIGEQIIDTHYSEWFDIWNELTDIINNEHFMVNKNVGKTSYLYSVKNSGENNEVTWLSEDDKLICYVPLQFWFCKNPGLALPLVALQHHSIKFYFTFRKMTGMFNTNLAQLSNPNITPNVNLLVDYIYLDKEERTKFATSKHQYLIEQVQRIEPQTLKQSHKLNFNHPVKEILWVCRNKTAGTEASTLTDTENPYETDATQNLSTTLYTNWKKNDYFNYVTSKKDLNNLETVGGIKSYEPFKTASILFNNIERVRKRKPSYFRIVQPSNYHSKVPTKHIYLYSFALKPEQLQPSGTCNFSIIQHPEIIFENPTINSDMEVIFFAINYNMLCIMNGMGGLRFSN